MTRAKKPKEGQSRGFHERAGERHGDFRSGQGCGADKGAQGKQRDGKTSFSRAVSNTYEYLGDVGRQAVNKQQQLHRNIQECYPLCSYLLVLADDKVMPPFCIALG